MSEVLAAGLARFAAEGGARRAGARAAQFTWEKCAAAYLGLYRACLAR